MMRAAFPEPLEFCYPWRPYQARVLGKLKSHLDDDRLHVVAAPGAGKTVLGLEVLNQLDSPALILAPTITIRNQWLDRLKTLFLKSEAGPYDWISTDIHQPGIVTSITYQALHCAMTGSEIPEAEDEEEEGESPDERPAQRIDVVGVLKQAGVETLILDECHHLRAAWWKALTQVVDEMPGLRVVALTATPPYDVPLAEWGRYQDLCGPVDAEISVPELVRERNLCPHQDYIYLSSPAAPERERLKAYRTSVRDLTTRLLKDENLIHAVQSHPSLKHPTRCVAEILDDIAFFTSIAVFLKASTGKPPRRLLRAMAVDRAAVPELTLEWWDELLQGCLFSHRTELVEFEETLEEIERGLRSIGAVERRKVRLRSTREMDSLLTRSMSKMNSICEIARLEHEALGDDLRQVILTDFIRAADMPRSTDDLEPVQRIGVVPIFEMLRREELGVRLGVLSGSLVVVPAEAVPAVTACAATLGMDVDRIALSPLRHDARYYSMSVRGADRKRIVRLATEVFSSGAITVLVGTKSLLGEGWDAPSVNSLVMASFVGSFMLSNQMRGRAIRVERDRPDKTANIWHLVCVEEERDVSGRPVPGTDWETMSRRFKAFAGPSLVESVIENGVERLGMEEPPLSEDGIAEVNACTVAGALDRDTLRARWQEAFDASQGTQMVHELRVADRVTPRSYVFVDAIKRIFMQGVAVMGFVLSTSRFEWSSPRLAPMVLAILFGIASVAALPWFLRALWLMIRHGSLAGSLRQVGKVLLSAMHDAGIIETPPRQIRVKVCKTGNDSLRCHLEGGTTFEKAQFLDALAELLDPIENPRYLLLRRSRLWFINRFDFHAIPTALGRKKEHAERFAHIWRWQIGRASAIYTRSEDGRRILLKARGRAMSSALHRRSERKHRWR